MKLREIQRLGLTPVISQSGALQFVLPVIALSEAAAQVATPAQLDAILETGMIQAAKDVAKIREKIAADAAKKASDA